MISGNWESRHDSTGTQYKKYEEDMIGIMI